MNYRFGFVLNKIDDYVRKCDMSFLNISQNDLDQLKIQYNNEGILYIEEDVNARKSDMFSELMEKKGYKVTQICSIKWKAFPEKIKCKKLYMNILKQ